MLNRLRKPEYTGDNRCWPCTALNASVLLLACVSLARLLPGKRLRRFGVASALGLVGGGTIALRGYLVPGTPQVAPLLVETLSSKPHPPEEAGSLAGDIDSSVGERALTELVDGDVVEADGESLYLNERFRIEWRAEMETVRDSDLVSAVRAVTPDDASVDLVEDEQFVVISTGELSDEQWLSRPVAIAETAAVRALADFGIDPDVRVQSASALRAFLDDCPVCDVSLEETSADRCCGSGRSNPLEPPDDVLACPNCEQRVFTY